MIYFKREDLPPAPDLPGHLLMRCVSGSQAYGMATPESDVDIRGIFVPTMKYMLGFMNRVEQIELKPETVIYAIQKYMALAANANPNILELLFVPEDCLLDVDPLYNRLVENRQLFLSRKVRYSYCGYAVSQIHRIEVHRRYLLHPMERPPSRYAFGLPEGEHFISREQVGAFYVTLAHMLRGMIDISEPEIKDLYRNVVAIVCSEAFPGWEGIVQSQGVPDAALPYVQKLTGASDNFIYALQREQAYYRQVDEWNKYQTWLKQRNPKRAELEARWGFDCYTDDTEFLTDTGWKVYKNVGETDKLATVRTPLALPGDHKCEGRRDPYCPMLGVEYQTPTARFSGTFTGELHLLNGHHTDVAVTPNHRMLYCRVETNTHKKHPWLLEEATTLPRSFEVLRTVTPDARAYKYDTYFEGLPISPIGYVRLMGWYLSEGTIPIYKRSRPSLIAEDGPCHPKAIVLSQKLGGRLSRSFADFMRWWGTKINVRLRDYPRPAKTPPLVERRLFVKERILVERMLQDCGRLTEKHIPRWMFKVGKRLGMVLLEALHDGDGTDRHNAVYKNRWVYYTSLRQLADDVQELAFLCGAETARWGPYEYDYTKGCAMYQVHVNFDVPQTRRLTSRNVHCRAVTGQNIVCFTVPNSVLVTRRNGCVGIHGNSKHASHAIRLVRQGEEIMRTGTLTVRLPDADKIRAIRDGVWLDGSPITYEKVVDYVKQKEVELQQLYTSLECVLPKEPDRKTLDELCIEIVRKANE